MSTVKGKIVHIGQTETVGTNGFTKRICAIETPDQYPQTIGIEFVKDKTALLDMFDPGDNVEISINIRGREYNGKYYVNLEGWKIDKA